ncbi:hypothetical protein [Streptomyces sp. NPDC003719]
MIEERGHEFDSAATPQKAWDSSKNKSRRGTQLLIPQMRQGAYIPFGRNSLGNELKA